MTSFFGEDNKLENCRVQGLFDFSRIMRYDPYEASSEVLPYIQVHEATHFCLTTSTIYGNIHYMIDQLAWRAPSKTIQFAHISKELLNASRHVHEAVATFSEYAAIKASEDENFYQNKLKELFKNREYYNYVKDLLFLLDLPNFDTSQNLIYKMGMIALNIDSSQLPNGLILQPKELEKFLVLSEWVDTLRPTRRFNVLVKTLKSALKDTKIEDISGQLLLSRSGLQHLECDTTNHYHIIKWLHDQLPDSDAKTLIHLEFLKEAEQYVGCQPSKEYQENIAEDIWRSLIPSPMSRRFKIKDCNFSSMKLDDDWALIFLALNSSDCFLGFSNILSGITYKCRVTPEQLLKDILYEVQDIPIVVIHDHYPNIKVKKKLFVYIDSPYYISRTFIQDHISLNKNAFLLIYNQSTSYLFLEMQRGDIMIQPIALTDIQSKSEIVQEYNILDCIKAIPGNLSLGLSLSKINDLIYALAQDRKYSSSLSNKIAYVIPNH